MLYRVAVFSLRSGLDSMAISLLKITKIDDECLCFSSLAFTVAIHATLLLLNLICTTVVKLH